MEWTGAARGAEYSGAGEYRVAGDSRARTVRRAYLILRSSSAQTLLTDFVSYIHTVHSPHATPQSSFFNPFNGRRSIGR